MNEPLIELRDVDFAYDPARPVLTGCNFALCRGERVALVGTNGSGKTTLLQLIVGLLRPQRGQIVVHGRERRAEADFHEVRRRVGLLFQDADDQLFCPTVAEDVAFGPLNLQAARGSPRHRGGNAGLIGPGRLRASHHLSSIRRRKAIGRAGHRASHAA